MKVNKKIMAWKRMTRVVITASDRQDDDRMSWPDGGWGAFIFVAIFQALRAVLES